MSTGKHIGVIVQGSLSEGLTAKLARADAVEEMRVGKFVVIEGVQHRYFSLITDIELHMSDQRLLADPPTNPFVRQVLAGSATYGTVEIAPMLMLARNASAGNAGPQPVRTIPGHFSSVLDADDGDFRTVFGAEDQEHPNHFSIGMPLDNDVPLCLDLNRFIERSNGVFGKSGTGKSFLTRLILAGLIKKDVCSNLIFDMHSEYGWEGSSETTSSRTVQGLKQLFRNKVLIYTLDPKATAARNASFDGEVRISAGEVTAEDIALLSHELSLPATAPETIYLLQRHFSDRWLPRFLDINAAELDELSEQTGAHAGSLQALRRRLMLLKRKPFIDWEDRTPADGSWESLDDAPRATSHGVVRSMLEAITAGKHIVLEFGTHNDMLSYLLVANILTRSIRQHYVEQKERYMATKDPAAQPRPLMITVEEAHKFLDPSVARDTTFGILAREMRKYDVTLLVVDQRPSAIDSEVLSQIGTRIVCLLDDEKDVDAILSGVSGASRLRGILATLETRGQAMLLGHALPMPVTIRTRAYDETFWAEMRGYGDERSRGEDIDRKMARFARL
jgi:DNA helicase HerA-like ATPase